MTMAEFSDIVDAILDEDVETASTYTLLEAEEQELLRALNGENTLLNYLIKFEGYLSDLDIYLFDGWESARIIGRPKVEKFWVTVDLHVGPKTDLRGAVRVRNDKEAQNEVKQKVLDDGSRILRFKILKRYLDQLEQQDKERRDQISDSQLERND